MSAHCLLYTSSEESGVRGCRASNISSRESGRSSLCSCLEYAFTLLHTSSTLQMRSSSAVPRLLPISRHFKEPRISQIPEKESDPFWYIRFKASLVSFCKRRMVSRSEEGSRLRHSSFPKACLLYTSRQT